mgnify:CR=1 FL=1
MPAHSLRYCKAFVAAGLLFAAYPLLAATVDVQLKGIRDDAIRNNTEGFLAINKLEGNDSARPRAIRRLHRRAEQDIQDALRPFGFYNPVIRSELEPVDGGYKATYVVDTGPPTTLRDIRIEITGPGSGEQALRDTVQASRLRADAPLRHPLYNATKSAIRDTAFKLGYLDARFTAHRLAVDPSVNRADVELVLESGDAYEFGEIRIDQDVLDPEFLNRYVNVRTGERFDSSELVNLQLHLADLGYFDQVQVDANKDDAQDHRIPVVVRTTPLASQRYEAGVGYGTDTGARLTAGAEWRRLNRQGHQLDLSFQLSEVINTLTTQYLIPVGSVPGDSVTFSAGAEDEDLEDGERRTLRLEAARNWQLGDWYRRYYLQFLREDYELSDEQRLSILLTPGVSFTRTEVSDPVFARNGWSTFFDVHGAVRDVLSDTSFIQSRLRLQGVLPVFSRGRLLLRTEVGGSWTEEFSDLPASERFFAGGDSSVRGYAYESLGPEDDEGRVIGGEFLLTGSVEYEQIIWRGMGAAVFVDAGNAADAGIPEPVYGAGIGFRYRSPVGVIRIDVAHPFDDPERAARLHIGVRAGL